MTTIGDPVLIGSDWRPPITERDVIRDGGWSAALPPEVNAWRQRNRRFLQPGLEKWEIARRHSIAAFVGCWFLDMIDEMGNVEPLGLASMDLVTEAGAVFVTSAMAGAADLTQLRYLGIGQGAAPATFADTELDIEITETTDNIRTTAAMIPVSGELDLIRLQGPYLYLGSDIVQVRELGVFSSGVFGAGTLFDRAAVSGVTLNPFSGLVITYTCQVLHG